jgi:hypothetical protein
VIPLALKLTRALIDGLITSPSIVKLLVPALNGAHFFETTAALPLLDAVGTAAAKNDGPFIPCTFLPAPKTWIEWQPPGERRHAVCFTKGDALGPYLKEYRAVPDTWAIALHSRAEGALCKIEIAGWVDLTTGRPCLNDRLEEKYPGVREQALASIIRATYLLAIINSPRIVVRRAHTPNKGVARKLNRTPGLGIGPLHDWHEIRLEINKPRYVDDGEPHADVISGKRALHFCRKHLRLWNGRLIPVREHWRGSASVGIRRGRYVVTADPQEGHAS